MHMDDEFFSFTTPNVGFRYPERGKHLLVTVQCHPSGPRVILVHKVTQTTIKMLEISGAPHFPADKLPEHMRQKIECYYAESIRIAMDRMGALYKLKEPSEHRIQ